ncbi:MAG: tyrosine recombinase, partial [Acidimicrobiia bacterium]
MPGSGTAAGNGAALPLEVEEYLSWLVAERGRAANTVAAYRRDLTRYVGWLAGRGQGPAGAGSADLEDHVAHLRAAGLAPASVTRAMVAVRNLHRFLADEGEAPGDPGVMLEVPRVPRGIPKALPEAEVAALLAAVTGADPRARRDRAILEVLYGTGLRIGELVGLSLADLDVHGGYLRAFGKGSKERVVPLMGMAAEAVTAWLAPGGRPELVPDRWARRDDAEAVFLNARGGRLSRQGAWGVVRRYGEAVGIADRLSPHVLRHSCATHLLDHGADVRVVQELRGHATISTTQRYTHVSTQRQRSARAAAHPRVAPH